MVVREDSLTLFGFADEDEKQMFELVQTASGVGPKLAQAMLAVHRPETLRRAVSSEDVKTLTSVPGIGQKGAQRIILELRDRIGPPRPRAPASPTGGPPRRRDWQDQVQAGLVGLGWSAKEADRAVGDGRARGRADGQPRRRRAAARGAADAEQGLTPVNETRRSRPPRLAYLDRAGRSPAADADGDERAVEAALRPRTLDEVVGQERVREQLSLVLEAARAPRPRARPRAALRSARAGQDHPGDDHRRRDERAAAR